MPSKAQPGAPFGVIIVALLVVWLAAAVIAHASRYPLATFTTGAGWNRAPRCGRAPASGAARCVTRRMSGFGNLPYGGPCSPGLYGDGCSFIPGAARFADGSRQEFDVDDDGRATPDPDDLYGRVVGQFRGRRLVGLVFRDTGVSLDIKGASGVHAPASVVARIAPFSALAAFVAWLVRGMSAAKAERERRRLE